MSGGISEENAEEFHRESFEAIHETLFKWNKSQKFYKEIPGENFLIIPWMVFRKNLRKIYSKHMIFYEKISEKLCKSSSGRISEKKIQS